MNPSSNADQAGLPKRRNRVRRAQNHDAVQITTRTSSSVAGGRSTGSPTVFARLASPQPTKVFDSYWRFAAERQAIFLRRIAGQTGPWTTDSILSEYKFTNAYRASDRISQFLIRRVIYAESRTLEDLVFRTLLFKIFNRVDTWQRLVSAFGDVTVETFSLTNYDAVLSSAIERGERLYSAAYIMPTAPRRNERDRKHTSHLCLIHRIISDGFAQKLAQAKSMAAAFAMLRAYPSVGDFLAYQFVTDLNYNEFISFSETDFVVPGPGALDGLRKCFESLGDMNEPDTIRWVMDRQQYETERLGLEPINLWGRPLQLIDCQNLFCEVDKYARVRHPEVKGRTGRTKIKQRFTPSTEPLTPWYPPKWGINNRIQAFMATAARNYSPSAF
jgi:hypothetical protein